MAVTPPLANPLNVTVIGGGLIGASWAALFLAHGHRVCVHDIAPDAAGRVREELLRLGPVMAQLGFRLDPGLSGLTFDADLESAVGQADIVQECGPERLAFKRSLWARVERHAKPEALFLSSSSGITASMQASKMKTPQRMLIGHPFNPPHLIPLVEVVPGRHTADDAVRRACAFYDSLGKRTITLRKEIPGFVANRIQAAVLRESISLVRQGVVSVADLDAAVQCSLGLRWACGGPLLSAHLGGGTGGIQAFFKQFATGLQLLWLHTRLRPVLLTGRAQRGLVDQIEQAYGSRSIAEWAGDRDVAQMALLHNKSTKENHA